MSGGERSSASPMTVEEAVRQARREARQMRVTRMILEQMQAAIPAPSPEELAEMERGVRPVSAEAHLLGVLEEAIGGLENVENGLRFTLSAKALWDLEKDWQRGNLPNQRDLKLIRSAASRRNA
jgi:hypothetical protein